VPGVGDVQAQWLFVGEAPGAEEDARGEPFVGQAGRLLDNMLAALGMKRGENVYIANVLKCRPPGNRTPSPLETESCRPYLDRQIALIVRSSRWERARRCAAQRRGTIASLRGRVHRYQRAAHRYVPPAYLLRNLPDKAKAWEDLCLARSTVRGLQAANASAGLQIAATVPKMSNRITFRSKVQEGDSRCASSCFTAAAIAAAILSGCGYNDCSARRAGQVRGSGCSTSTSAGRSCRTRSPR
jgi:uracil-DNA glycosylase family 4